MSELQNESVDSEFTEPTETVEQPSEVAADLATASEAEHEEQPQVDDAQEAERKAQEAIQKTINKKHYEAKEAERKAAEYKQKLDEYEAKQREQLAARVADIPPVPDAFDDDYEAKVAERDRMLLAKAEFDADQRAVQRQQEFQQQQELQQKQAEIQESMTNYSKKAVELGIDQNELQAAGNTVASYGLSDDLVLHILGDSDGPLITKHLAANPQEGFELANMSPYQVGSFLDNIKQKAGALKPKSSNAPPPSDKLSSSGIKPEDGYQNIKGAKFE